MRLLGEISLLLAFVSIGYSAFACLMGSIWERPQLRRTGHLAATGGMVLLTVVLGVLAWALLVRDFRFHYVAQYSSRLLPWHYSLSALWVGQAGSLLLWAWLMGLLALVFRFRTRSKPSRLDDPAFAFLMGYCGFLVVTMVFAADPMEANIAPGEEGAGLSPLLQHPAMLIHPPIVFLGYAAWAVPCALGIAALVASRRAGGESAGLAGPAGSDGADKLSPLSPVDSTWVAAARPWALFAWTVLGIGILLGAYWSYEELGWGGYWAWDPVENGSLIPWLIGSAFIHALMTWHFRGVLKKTSIGLAISAFALCNFATFLTRSGIFSSLHAFSESPIGWLFLGLMLVLGVGGAVLIFRSGRALSGANRISSVWSREAFVVLSIIALLLMATATLAGTLSVALSDAIVGRRIIVGTAFYNSVLVPIGLLLLATMGAAPLLRWGAAPRPGQVRALGAAGGVASIAAIAAGISGVTHPLSLAVAWLAAFAVAALVAALVLDARRCNAARPWQGLGSALVANRRMYAGFVIHLGFVCIAVGVTGSSLGTRRQDFSLTAGQVVQWAGRSIRFRRLIQRELPEKLIVEAELEVSRPGRPAFRLLPAQHLHRLQNQWTTEVAVRSTWGGDFYTILHNGETDGEVRLTLVENPLMRWMWFGGWLSAAGTLLRLWPSRRKPARSSGPPRPKFAQRAARQRQSELISASEP